MFNAAIAALLDHLKADAGLAALIKTFDRPDRIQHWRDVPPAAKPYLAVTGQDFEPKTDWGKAVAWHVEAQITVYTQASAADGSAQALRNQVIAAVDCALRLQPGMGRQTLGGRVHNCRLGGKVETDHATTGGDGVAFIPVLIRPTL